MITKVLNFDVKALPLDGVSELRDTELSDLLQIDQNTSETGNNNLETLESLRRQRDSLRESIAQLTMQTSKL